MRLHLVDGTYELFRAHFSRRPPRQDPDGRDVKATVGVVQSLLALLHDEAEAVTHIAVAFDNPIRSFRNRLYPGYKDDTGVPPELHAQFDDVELALEALGVAVWSMDEYEADDALATAAARWTDDADQVRILTPDKDLGQCVRGQRVVQVDRRQQRVLDEDAVAQLRGVGVKSIPDWLALVGDSADGFPGIPGFGARTAAALLTRWGHLEDVPLDAGLWKGLDVRGADRLAATLRERHDEALLYRELATLVTEVALPHELEDLRFRGTPRERFLAWCDDLGIGEDLRERPSRWS